MSLLDYEIYQRARVSRVADTKIILRSQIEGIGTVWTNSQSENCICQKPHPLCDVIGMGEVYGFWFSNFILWISIYRFKFSNIFFFKTLFLISCCPIFRGGPFSSPPQISFRFDTIPPCSRVAFQFFSWFSNFT